MPEPGRQHPDGLAAAKAKATPGLCIFCEEPLPASARRPRIICRERGCRAAYNSAYQRDHRRHAKRPRAGFVTWHCGCGMVTRRSGWGTHKLHCIFAAAAWPVVVIPRAAA